MFKKIFSVFLVTVILFTATILTGCDNSSRKTPDSVIDRFVRDSKYYESDIYTTWYASHIPDKAANTDSLYITLTAEDNYGEYTSTCSADYQYDRASGNWSLINSSEWTDRKYRFNENLEKIWTLNDNGSEYTISVLSVSGTTIELEYFIKEKVYAGLTVGNVYCELSGRTTAIIENNHFEIPLTLSNGFFANEGGFGGNKTQNTKLTVYMSIDNGIYQAIFYDQINYSSN